jgi:uncharacterized protein with PIN domain
VTLMVIDSSGIIAILLDEQGRAAVDCQVSADAIRLVDIPSASPA